MTPGLHGPARLSDILCRSQGSKCQHSDLHWPNLCLHMSPLLYVEPAIKLDKKSGRKQARLLFYRLTVTKTNYFLKREFETNRLSQSSNPQMAALVAWQAICFHALQYQCMSDIKHFIARILKSPVEPVRPKMLGFPR